MRVPWTARRSNQSSLKKTNPEYSLEGLMLKLQYLDHLMQRADLLEKTLMLEKIKGQKRRGQQRMRWLDSITDSVDMNLSKLWKILKEVEIPDHLTCLLRNLYAVLTEHGTTDWFQIRKGVHQGCILSPCLFNLYAEYI